MAFQSKYTGSQIESILGNAEKKIVATVDLDYDSFDQILDTNFERDSCPLSYCNIEGYNNLVDLMKLVFFTKDASQGYSIDLSVKLNGNITIGLSCSISAEADNYRLNIFDPESLLGGYITYDNSTPDIFISKGFSLVNTESTILSPHYEVNTYQQLLDLIKSKFPPYIVKYSCKGETLNKLFSGWLADTKHDGSNLMESENEVPVSAVFNFNVQLRLTDYVRGFVNFNRATGINNNIGPIGGFGNFQIKLNNGLFQIYGLFYT